MASIIETAKLYQQVSTESQKKFDELLLETIDEVLKTAFGEKSTQMIYDYLKMRSCPSYEVPQKLGIFSAELRNILYEDNSPARFLASVTPMGRCAIIERTILRILCKKLGFSLQETGPINFPSAVSELRILHNSEKERLLPPPSGKEETEKN